MRSWNGWGVATAGKLISIWSIMWGNWYQMSVFQVILSVGSVEKLMRNLKIHFPLYQKSSTIRHSFFLTVCVRWVVALFILFGKDCKNRCEHVVYNQYKQHEACMLHSVLPVWYWYLFICVMQYNKTVSHECLIYYRIGYLSVAVVHYLNVTFIKFLLELKF